eukprot:9051184-Pyramimonas_sp.AAC.1
MEQCTTGLRDSHGVLRREPIEIMANHRLVLTPFERKRCTGHHQRASVCNKELPMVAQCTAMMQLLFVEAVKIAYALVQVTRDPFHCYPYSSTVLVTNVRGYDLDDPGLPRQPDGSIARPPSGGFGCPACADNVNMHSPSHVEDPRPC